MKNKKVFMKLSCVIALSMLGGCSSSNVSNKEVTEQKNVASKGDTVNQETKNKGKIKITDQQRSIEPRFEIIESQKVDAGDSGFLDEKNSFLREVLILRDKQTGCKYLYTFSANSIDSGSATMTPLECEKKG